MKRNLFLMYTVALGLTLVLVLAACGGGGSTGGDSGGSEAEAGGTEAEAGGEPITIGFAMGFTGFANAFDGPVFNGARVAIDEINEKGGIDGREIKIVKADTKSELERVPTAAQEVIEDGAEVVVTTCDYDYGGPAARVAQEEGILAVGCAGSPLYGRQGIGPLAFNALDTTPNEAAAMTAFAKKKGWKKAYILSDTTIEYSKGGCEFFKEAWTAAGGEVAGEDTFQNEDPSIDAQVSRMRESDAEFIALCSYLPGVTAAVRQIRAGGVDVPIVAQAGVDGRVVSTAVPNLTGLYYVSIGSIHGEDPDQRKTEFGEKYEELTGSLEVQDYAPLLGASEIETIAKGIEGAGGSTEGTALADVIQKFHDEELLIGPTTYSEECHTPIERPLSIFEINDGKVVVAEQSVIPTNVPKAPC